MADSKSLTTSQIVANYSSLFIALAIGIAGFLVQDSISKRSIKSTYTELAIAILTQSNSEELNPELREWAVHLLQKNSPITLPDNTAKKLADGSLSLPPEVEVELSRLRKFEREYVQTEAERQHQEEMLRMHRTIIAPSFLGLHSSSEQANLMRESYNQQINMMGYDLTFNYAYRQSSQPRGTIIDQYPQPNETIASDHTLLLILSDGSE